MPTPKLATAGITDRIQALSSTEAANPFEVKALQRDIDIIKAHNAAEAYMLSGMLYSALNDYENSKDMHLKCLRLSAGLVEHVNYGISLRKVGRLTEAKEIFLKAFALSPSSIDVFKKIVHTLTFLMDYECLDEYLERLYKASPGTDVEDEDYMRTARSILGHLNDLEIPVSEYKLVGSYIEHALIDSELLVGSMHEKLSSFDGSEHLYIEIPVRTKDASQLVELNERVSEQILASEELTCWDKIIVNFVRNKPTFVKAVA